MNAGASEPPRLELAQLPTPLVRAERLSRAWGAPVWFKRDDLTGLELSGNKVRKLEYILAAAQRAGCDTIVTEGTAQSNHCRATVAACARLGMRAVLLLRPPPREGPPQGNHLLDVLFGAECRSYPRDEFEQRRDSIVRDVLDDLRQRGCRPRFVPMGASEPLGCWGYIRAAAELQAQLAAAGIGTCDLVLAVSSGGTLAGLMLGTALHGLGGVRVIAIAVSDDAAWHRRQVQALCARAAREFGLPLHADELVPDVRDGYVGPGYAVPYGEALAVLREVARTEGVLLDPVYTAKAFWGLRDLLRRGELGRDRAVVFLHTGGALSDFAWPELLTGADAAAPPA